jgi:predicted ATPase
MIRRISIENFKSLKKADIKVSNLNLLMGVNGMGKSSFMQVLLLLRQSDKLGDGVIDLNGTLAQIGQGKDALYQFAEEESIVFELAFDEQSLFSWKFPCQSDKEKLTAETSCLRRDMILFGEQMKRFQYVSAERIGPRDIYDASNTVVSDDKQFGLFGEFAVHYINVFGLDGIVPQPLRKSTAFSSDRLIHQLTAWMQEISPGVSINTKYIPEANKVVLDYQFDLVLHKTNSFRPKNVGFGISYVLPIVLALLTAEDGKIIVIENPESHIHPRGQAELGKLIALAANTGAQIFVETHSDHILNGIRVAVKEQHIDKSKVNVLYFDKVTTDSEQYTQITPIRVDKNGELSDYPKDFLDEWTNQLLKLI